MALKLDPKKINRKLTLKEVLGGLEVSGLITSEQKESVLKKKTFSTQYPLLSIANCDLEGLGLSKLVRWLAEYAELDYYHIDPLKIDISAVSSVLPKAYVKRLGILPIAIERDHVVYATSEPFWTEWMMDVEGTTKKKIKIVVADPNVIQHCIEDFYTVHKAVKSLHRKNVEEDVTRSKDIEKILGKGSEITNNRDESGVSGIVDWLFQYAYDERATDIHLEPKQGRGIIRFRVDGVLRDVYKFDPEIMLSVSSRIKILADMKVDEKRRPQDGRIKRSLDDERVIEIRASVIPTHFGEKIVLRIFDPLMADKSLEEIGFEERDRHEWEGLSEHSHGMVLVTGPTGSGKSTTLHATLKHLASPEVNICTAEDPIEIINDGFNQMQINHDIDLSFANAIRSFLRQDPDIIMVGEIRDMATAEMAIQASLTGHMVMSTLHTNDALSAFTRLLDLGVPSHLLNATLKGVLAQRLVRVLCPSCKEKVKTDQHMWNSLCRPHKVKMPEFVYEARGCNDCKNTGYQGRVCVYEMIKLTNKIKSVVKAGADLSDIRAAAEGTYLPIRLHGAKKIMEGVTDIAEILRVVI